MSDETEILRQQIASKIREAFADTPYPGDNNIGWGCGWEGAEFEEVIRGQHWKDLSLEFIIKHRDKIHCMTDEGFRFYLPAFMLGVLLHWEDVDTLSLGLISSLVLPNPDRIRQSFNMFPKLAEVYSKQEYADMQTNHFLQKATLFNSSEKAAIAAVLSAYPVLFPQDLFEHDRARQAADFWKSTN